MWPGGWDQPHVANEVVELGIAREFVQTRMGYNIGRKTARGVLVTGTDQAILEEMEEIFTFMSSAAGEKMRKWCEEVKQMVIQDMESGRSHENMLALGRL